MNTTFGIKQCIFCMKCSSKYLVAKAKRAALYIFYITSYFFDMFMIFSSGHIKTKIIAYGTSVRKCQRNLNRSWKLSVKCRQFCLDFNVLIWIAGDCVYKWHLTESVSTARQQKDAIGLNIIAFYCGTDERSTDRFICVFHIYWMARVTIVQYQWSNPDEYR